MIHLLNNLCVDQVEMDLEGGANEGEIYFARGETYSGEVID